MLVCDNSQATIPGGWFAGFLEGEGSFDSKLKGGTSNRIKITNTDLDLIEACEKYLKDNNIFFTTQEEKKIKGRKTVYNVYIKNNMMLEFYEYCNKLFDIIGTKVECRRKEFLQTIGIESSETTCVLSVDLDWLIGIFEAEGTILLINNNGRSKIDLDISLCNTNFSIMEKLQLNLNNLGCTYYCFEKSGKIYTHKTQKGLRIWGMKRCYKFLKATEGHWIAKRNQKRTSLMLEFIESRFSKDIKESYSERELQIVQTMSQLNKRG